MGDGPVIGVDGGGTGSRARLVWPARSIDVQTTGGPANVFQDREGAVANIHALLADLGAKSGVDDLTVIPKHLGLAGVLRGADPAPLLTQLDIGWAQLSDDQVTSLAGALGGKDGWLVSLGTGSFVGVQSGADIRFLGGYGLFVGDQASGGWLGKRALEHALLVRDGLAKDGKLARGIWDRFDNDPNAVIQFSQTTNSADYAALAALVFASADDPAARGMIDQAVGYVCGALVTLGYQGAGRVCLTGGIAERYIPFLPENFAKAVEPVQANALEGAVILAGRM